MVLFASTVLLSDETDFWADSESDSEVDLAHMINYDPEVSNNGAGELWKCINCEEPNTPFMRYCSRCWKVKNWIFGDQI